LADRDQSGSSHWSCWRRELGPALAYSVRKRSTPSRSWICWPSCRRLVGPWPA